MRAGLRYDGGGGGIKGTIKGQKRGRVLVGMIMSCM